MINTSSIYVEFGDCRELLKKIESETIALVVTSPPYNIGKPYGKYKDRIHLNDWEELIQEVTNEIFRVLKPNGSYFLNLSPIPYGVKKEILPLPFLGYKIMKNSNFYIRNIITWTFNNMQNCSKRLSGRYENIIWGVKDLDNYIFNLDDIRIPYITKNDKRLDPNGGRNPTDVWYFNRVNNMTKKSMNLTHPTIFPYEMIERIVKMSSNVNDIVLDPFLGSGTTVVVANNLSRRGIGFEIDNNYEEEIKYRLEKEKKEQLYLF